MRAQSIAPKACSPVFATNLFGRRPLAFARRPFWGVRPGRWTLAVNRYLSDAHEQKEGDGGRQADGGGGTFKEKHAADDSELAYWTSLLAHEARHAQNSPKPPGGTLLDVQALHSRRRARIGAMRLERRAGR